MPGKCNLLLVSLKAAEAHTYMKLCLKGPDTKLGAQLIKLNLHLQDTDKQVCRSALGVVSIAESETNI